LRIRASWTVIFARMALLTCNSLKMQYDMVATGRFLGLFPRSVLHFGITGTPIRVLPVEMPARLPTELAPVGIVTLKNRTISPVARLFLQTVREVARPLARKKS